MNQVAAVTESSRPQPKVPPGAWWILASVAAGNFMSALDCSVVNVVWPVIGEAFHASVASIEWVVIIYLLVVSGTLLMFGRIGDMFGHKKMYMTGFCLFVLGSVLCGLSPNAYVLVGFRGFQALGAAMLFASSPAITTSNFPPSMRGRVLGTQGTFTYLGLTMGPPIGAFLAARFGWQAIFYVNVPVGITALLLAWRFIPAGGGSGARERFDVPGAATFFVGLVALVLALNMGSQWGWTSTGVLVLLAVAVGLLAAFILLERRRTHPLVDLSLFRNRTFSASTLTAVLNYVCVYTVIFLMPSYLQHARALSLSQAGALLMVMPLVMAIMTRFAGSLSDRIGTRTPSVAGMVVLAVSLLAFGLLGPTVPIPLLVLVLALMGFGIGIFVSPNNSALLGSSPLNRRGIASGILAEARNVGMVLGVALAGSVFTSVLHGTSPGANTATFHAVSAGFFVAAGVAVAGAVTAGMTQRYPRPVK
ncbi:MAG: MFS transporter [Coriobacteriia bacterium]|nr:MFS transporter [Coriobacteriia bacterium]